MRRLCRVAAALWLPVSGSAQEGRLLTPGSEVKALARYQAPKGWEASEDRLGSDPAVSLSNPPYTIRIQLFGGKGSRHASLRGFLDSPEAQGQDGKPAAVVRKAPVAGSEVPIYFRSYKLDFSDPDGGPGGEAFVSEEFCVIAIQGRFFLLSYSMSRPDSGGEFKQDYKDWTAFLASFKLVH